MKSLKKLRSYSVELVLVLLLISVSTSGYLIYRDTQLNNKVTQLNRAVSGVDGTLTCPQVWNDGSTGKQYCISVNDEFTDLKSQLGTIQNNLQDIQDTLH